MGIFISSALCMWICKKNVFDFGTLDCIFFINLIDVRLWCFGHFNFAIEFVSLCRSMVAVKMHFSEIFFFQICIQYRIAALVKKERKIKTNILFMRAKKMSSIGFWCNGCFFLHWCKSSWIVVLKLVTFIFFIN